MILDSVRSLLDAPSAAALVTYRPDGSADVSPVWFRHVDDAFEVVIAEGDPKLDHLARDPRAVLTVFETSPPFRGVKVAGRAELGATGVRDARLAIVSRYLGAARGEAFVNARGSGMILRLPGVAARVWDLSGILPPDE